MSWRTPQEDTPYISVFRFILYEPIFYLEPNRCFPQANMHPGWYVGIARLKGDAFTFHVLTEDKRSVIKRSVIRKRKETDIESYARYEYHA